MTEQELSRELLRTMHRARRIRSSVVLEPLTRSEFFSLAIMQEHSTEGVYVSAIADKLEVTSPAVSRMLRSMEEKGLIERVTDSNDRRNTRVTATDKGKDLHAKTKCRFEQYLERVVHRMGENELVAMMTAWNRTLDIMEIELENEQGEVINV